MRFDKRLCTLMVSIVLALAAMLAALPAAALAEEGDPIASGTCGTCPWEITSKGELVIHEGELENVDKRDKSVDYEKSWPWCDYRDRITSARFDGTVVAGAGIAGIFDGMSNLVSVDLTGLDTSKTTNMNAMFNNCNSLVDVDFTKLDASHLDSMFWMFSLCYSLERIDLSTFDTSRVTDMEWLFWGCESLESIDLSPLDTSNVTNMGNLFAGCKSLTFLDLSPLDTSQVEDMKAMLAGLESLTFLDLSPLDTTNVTTMEGMFSGCTSLTKLDLSPLDTSHVVDMKWMFQGCSSLTSIDLTPLKTSHVTDMSSLFSGCSSLTKLDLSPLDTSRVTTMSGMFEDCSSLTKLDLSPLDTSQVTAMGQMFWGCSSLTTLDLSPLDTSQVTGIPQMFWGCSSLTSIDLSPLDTSHVTNMCYLFSGCSSLTSIDLSPLITSQVENMSGMFEGCSSLAAIDLTPLDTSQVKEISHLFKDCSSLESLDLSTFDTGSVGPWYDMLRIFEGCDRLRSWTIGTEYVHYADPDAHLVPTPTAAEEWKWWSMRSQKWLTPEEVAARVGVADTYTSYEAEDEDLTGRYVSGFHRGSTDLFYYSNYHVEGDSHADGHVLVPLTSEWDDDWFHADSRDYNHELATTSMILADAAYHDHVDLGATNYIDDRYLAKADLEKLGFDPKTFYSVYLHKESDYEVRDSVDAGDYGIDRVSFTFGVKWIDDGHTPLVAVLVRGTPSNIEWVSNFNVADSGEGEYHEGFDKARRQVLDHLRAYLSTGKGKDVKLSKARFLVTGHSRGAAVANLLGHDLDLGAVSNDTGSSAPGRTYVYTFATPAGSAASDLGDMRFANIFNIVNPDDTIPKVALAGWGYGRYGVTKVLPSKSIVPAWEWYEVHGAMNEQFKRQTGGNSHETYFVTGAMTPNALVRALRSFCPDVPAFYGGWETTVYVPRVGVVSIAQGYSTDAFFKDVGRTLGGVKGGGNVATALLHLSATCPQLAAAVCSCVVAKPVESLIAAGLGAMIGVGDIAPAFKHAHCQDTYIAWMKSGDESMYVDSYRGLKVACPVDVRVWELRDGGEALVCSIVDGVVDEGVAETGLAAMVEGEVKYVDIPDGAEYRVELTAAADGIMDVAFEDRDAEGAATAQVAWAGLGLEEGRSYELDVSEDVDDALALAEEAVLSDPSGEVVGPDHVASAGEVGAIAVSVGVGSGEGVAAGSCQATWGDPVTVCATPAEGWEFAGWYEGGELVGDAAAWTFRAEADRALEARFARAIDGAEVAPIPDQPWTGGAVEPAVAVTLGGVGLAAGTDYELSYEGNVDVGEARVTVTGTGSYTGSVFATFKVVAADISGATVTVADQVYAGEALEPAPTVELGGRTLVVGADYAVAYKDNADVGTATVTVTGRGNYTGTKSVTFEISPADVSKATVSSIADQAYTGKAIEPAPVVKLGSTTLKSGTDYALSYNDNVNAGTATVIVTGKGNYAGAKSVTFKVTPADISKATVSSIADQAYTGKAVVPTPAVALGSTTLRNGTDYALSYKDNVNAGIATVTITGKGNYTGSVSKTFKIVKAAMETQQMYRLYNPNSGEHFYTAKAGERDYLVTVGWNYEGVGWTAPVESETPVYRLYNEVAGDHHYTMKAGEKDALLKIPGWKYEGIGWYSDDAKGTPLYRQYNPNAVTGSHNYTTNKKENDFLVTHGWKGEGIGWYGVKQ